MRQHVCVLCAQRMCYHRGSRKEMEEGEGTGERGRGIRRWGRGSSEGREGAESHSETFRLKQCQHIPIIPAHSLSPSLSAPLTPHPLSPLLYIPFRRRFIRQQMRLRQWRARNHTIKRGMNDWAFRKARLIHCLAMSHHCCATLYG